jgi:hypothetical protein
MTTLQITSLSQVKKLLDYGGAFNIMYDGWIMTVSYSDEHEIVGVAYDITYTIISKHYLEIDKNCLLGYTFHSWLLAPLLKEGEEVYCMGRIIIPDEDAGDDITKYGLFYGDDGDKYNAHYAVPCRLLEEDNPYKDNGFAELRKTLDDAIDKLTILSKKNNQ